MGPNEDKTPARGGRVGFEGLDIGHAIDSTKDFRDLREFQGIDQGPMIERKFVDVGGKKSHGEREVDDSGSGDNDAKKSRDGVESESKEYRRGEQR